MICLRCGISTKGATKVLCNTCYRKFLRERKKDRKLEEYYKKHPERRNLN